MELYIVGAALVLSNRDPGFHPNRQISVCVPYPKGGGVRGVSPRTTHDQRAFRNFLAEPFRRRFVLSGSKKKKLKILGIFQSFLGQKFFISSAKIFRFATLGSSTT